MMESDDPEAHDAKHVGILITMVAHPRQEEPYPDMHDVAQPLEITQ